MRDDAALGAALGTNTALTSLDISSNSLRSGRAIAAALATNRSLVHGNLMFNPLDIGSAAALAEATRASRARGVPVTLCGIAHDIDAIRLPRRGMRSSDALLLAAELETNPNVRTVDLSHNSLGPEAAAAIANALRQSATLTELNLRSNRVAGSWLDFGDEVGVHDDAGVLAIAESLSNGNTLTSLDLSLNALGETGARAVAEAAAQAPAGDPLRCLHVGSGSEPLPVQPLRGIATKGMEAKTAIALGGKSLDDLDAVVIATLIASNSRLSTLNLAGAAIGGVGCRALASALVSSGCMLTQLDLRGKSMLGEEGKLAIGHALLGAGSARVGCLACESFTLGPHTPALDLPGAMLSDADVQLLAGVLHHNTALLSLDLSHNGLGPAACAALCTALSRNAALVELDVYGNELTDDGAKLIADTLRTNATLTALSLGLNGLSGEGVRRVCHALESNASLLALSLENNGASAFTEAHAQRLLSSNRRRAAVHRHLPTMANGEVVPASRLHVHLCGGPGSGKTALAGALRRSGVGQVQKDDQGSHERTRGVSEQIQRYESRTFVVSDYCGRTEFALMHHHHHDRNARDFMAPSVYLILVNLMAGYEHAVEEVRWWRRYIRSLMPRGAMPPIALIGARADRVAKPNHLMSAIRDQANADGRSCRR